MLLEHFASWTEGRPASEDELRACHTDEHVARVRALDGPQWLDYDTVASETTWEAATLAAMRVSEDGFRELARRSAALAPHVGAVLEGGYELGTLPRLVEAALDGFSS